MPVALPVTITTEKTVVPSMGLFTARAFGKSMSAILFASTRKPNSNGLKWQRNSLAPITRGPDRRQIFSCLHPQTPFPRDWLSSVPPHGSAPPSGWQWTGGSNSNIMRGKKKERKKESFKERILKNMGEACSIPLLPTHWQEFSLAQSLIRGMDFLSSQSSVWKA